MLLIALQSGTCDPQTKQQLYCAYQPHSVCQCMGTVCTVTYSRLSTDLIVVTVCILLQARNYYIRDQWLHSIQWKVEACIHNFSAQHRHSFLADRTNGRAVGTVLRLSVVSDVMYCG